MKQIIKNHYIKILLLLALVALYLFLYKIYIPRINAFGCFDDCNNFMGGYFLLHGKRLFSEIFFNHNPLMAYISWIVQVVSTPENLYELILRHRQTLLIFSFLFNVLLVFRFGIPAFCFALFYELTKFYLFGDRFLAEGFIVYPLVYLAGLAWYKIQEKKIGLFDYVFAAICTWFILFMREPYVPAALVLFGYLLCPLGVLSLVTPVRRPHFIAGAQRGSPTRATPSLGIGKNAILAFGIFIILSLLTLLLHDVKEFYFNVVTANKGLISTEAAGLGLSGKGLFSIFFYPISLFFGGEWGYFRYLLLALNSLFIVSIILLLIKKQWKAVVSVLFILGLVNIRHVEPGKVFYSSFHLLCWYAIFLFASFMMLRDLYKQHKKIISFMGVLYAGILLFHIFSPLSFLQSKPDPQYELIINYGIPMQVGTVINVLSQPTDTLFVDGFDDIIYWQAHRYSSYTYSWYTSLMPYHKKYTDERIAMFRKSPPDFYYGSCPKEKQEQYLLPKFLQNTYVRLYADKKPSCLWVKKEKLKSITDEQWKKAEGNLYRLK